MYRPLPEEYIEQQFRIYAGQAKCKSTGIFEASCPSCREGKSWGRKKRLFYIPDYNNIHCKNCNKSWEPRQWIAEVSGKSYREINEESKDFEFIPIELLDKKSHIDSIISSTLPRDSITLNNKEQLEFYKNNKYMRACITFMISRRINKAVNRPDNFYISLNDSLHKNRLCLPFVNESGNVEFYQTREITPVDDNPLPKYIGKVGGTKTVFGVDKISEDLDYIFIFEGPIDSMFVRNGVAIGGVTANHTQLNTLKNFPFHKKIWVLDNQHIDETAKDTTKQLLDNGETVFIWKKGLESFKDFNDICIYKKINEISTKFIIDNSFTGLQGKFQMTKFGL